MIFVRKNIDLLLSFLIIIMVISVLLILNFYFIFNHLSFQVLDMGEYAQLRFLFQKIFNIASIRLLMILIMDFIIVSLVILYILKILHHNTDNIVKSIKKIKDGNLNFKIQNEHKRLEEIKDHINEMIEEYYKKVSNMKKNIDNLKEIKDTCKHEECKKIFAELEKELDKFNI